MKFLGFSSNIFHIFMASQRIYFAIPINFSSMIIQFIQVCFWEVITYSHLLLVTEKRQQSSSKELQFTSTS